MRINKLCGIYCIRKDDKFYIGQSVNIIGRFVTHKRLLLNNNHFNRKLQNSYNKYSVDYFEFEVIEICDLKSLSEKEQYWMKTLDTISSGYNIRDANDSYRSGSEFPLDVREKISIAQKKFWASKTDRALSKDHRENIGKALLGKKHPMVITEAGKKARSDNAKKIWEIDRLTGGKLKDKISKRNKERLLTEDERQKRMTFGGSKISFEIATNIRYDFYKNKLGYKELSGKYDTDLDTTRKIVSNKLFSEKILVNNGFITIDNVLFELVVPSNKFYAKLTKSIAIDIIRDFFEFGLQYSEIQEKYSISDSQVYRILHKNAWKAKEAFDLLQK